MKVKPWNRRLLIERVEAKKEEKDAKKKKKKGVDFGDEDPSRFLPLPTQFKAEGEEKDLEELDVKKNLEKIGHAAQAPGRATPSRRPAYGYRRFHVHRNLWLRAA